MKVKSNLIIRLTVFILVAISVYITIRLQMNFSEINEQRVALEQQLAQKREANEELADEIERPFDDNYVIRVAREKLDYHLPDEIIYYNDLN